MKTKRAPQKPLPQAFLDRMWKPGMMRAPLPGGSLARRGLRALIQDLTNDGELLVEFCLRVVLGQDLRLAQDWKPLLRGYQTFRRKRGSVFGDAPGRRARRNQTGGERLTAMQMMVGLLPEPPTITMDDRRWAVQILLSYGWGLPGRLLEDDPQRTPPESQLALKAAELLADFDGDDEIERARAARLIEVLQEPPPRIMTLRPRVIDGQSS